LVERGSSTQGWRLSAIGLPIQTDPWAYAKAIGHEPSSDRGPLARYPTPPTHDNLVGRGIALSERAQAMHADLFFIYISCHGRSQRCTRAIAGASWCFAICFAIAF
jgi:hypothetical protein